MVKERKPFANYISAKIRCITRWGMYATRPRTFEIYCEAFRKQVYLPTLELSLSQPNHTQEYKALCLGLAYRQQCQGP